MISKIIHWLKVLWVLICYPFMKVWKFLSIEVKIPVFFIISFSIFFLLLVFTLEHREKQINEMKLDSVFYTTITKYTNDPKETDDTPNITASGKNVKKGYIAVSRDLQKLGWTFGKRVYIEDIGLFEIQDVMNKRHHYSLDIFTFNRHEAIHFGAVKRWAYLIPNKVGE